MSLIAERDGIETFKIESPKRKFLQRIWSKQLQIKNEFKAPAEKKNFKVFLHSVFLFYEPVQLNNFFCNYKPVK